MHRRISIGLSLFALLGACSDAAIVAPSHVVTSTPAFAKASPASCVAPATTVVTTEEELHAALAAAQPGDVIAISGRIILTRDAEVGVERVTLTCAAPGDGLVAVVPAGILFDMLFIYAADVTVQGLYFDGTGIPGEPIFSTNSDFGSAVRTIVRGNTMKCGRGCIFLVASTGAQITDNYVESNAGVSGIHLQGNPSSTGFRPIDGTRVERNVLVATGPTGILPFGAIRPRDGANVLVSDNEISGPWTNGIATVEVIDPVYENNSIDGPTQYGLHIGTNPNAAITVRGLLAKGNDIRNTGSHAIRVNGTCNSFFIGNRVSVATGVAPILFTPTTGANVLRGESKGTVDLGNADCDGDGQPDPNSVSGGGKKADSPGSTVGQLMRHRTGVVMQ